MQGRPLCQIHLKHLPTQTLKPQNLANVMHDQRWEFNFGV